MKAEDLDFVHISHRVSEEKDGTERMDFFFYIKDWVGEPAIMEKDKCTHLDWFSYDTLPEETILYIKNILKRIQEGKNYTEDGWNYEK